MGLFDKVLDNISGEKISLSNAESFAGILLGTVSADGYISDEEKSSLWNKLDTMKLFSNWSDEQFNSMFNKLFGIQKKQGNDQLLKLCSSFLIPELKETAFAVAVDLVLADGSVEEAEKQFLINLQSILEIDENLAVKIIEVLAIKNKG